MQQQQQQQQQQHMQMMHQKHTAMRAIYQKEQQDVMNKLLKKETMGDEASSHTEEFTPVINWMYKTVPIALEFSYKELSENPEKAVFVFDPDLPTGSVPGVMFIRELNAKNLKGRPVAMIVEHTDPLQKTQDGRRVAKIIYPGACFYNPTHGVYLQKEPKAEKLKQLIQRHGIITVADLDDAIRAPADPPAGQPRRFQEGCGLINAACTNFVNFYNQQMAQNNMHAYMLTQKNRCREYGGDWYVVSDFDSAKEYLEHYKKTLPEEAQSKFVLKIRLEPGVINPQYEGSHWLNPEYQFQNIQNDKLREQFAERKHTIFADVVIGFRRFYVN